MSDESKRDTGYVSVEMFAASVGVLLIVLFIIISSVYGVEEKKPTESNLTQKYQLSWPDGSKGNLILINPENINIFEINKIVKTEDVCTPGKGFVNYAKKTYDIDRSILIFVITEKSMPTATYVRNCLRSLYLNKATGIGWIVANDSLLKIKSLNELPTQ